MRLLSSLIALVVLLRFASAFGDTGKSERVFYYYAYLLDAALNKDAGPQTIASGCSKSSGKGKKNICSFNDFIKYIYSGNTPPADWNSMPETKAPDGTLNKYPDAATLNSGEHGTSGPYDTKRIFNNAAKGDVGDLIQRLTNFVTSTIGALPDGDEKTSIKSGVLKAIEGVARSRMEAKLNDIKTTFNTLDKGKPTGYSWQDGSTQRNTRIVFVTREISLYTGALAGVTVGDIDFPATFANNQNVPREEMKGALNDYNSHDAPGHNTNIKAAREGCSVLKDVCI